MKEIISLTKFLQVANTSHILYLFEDTEKYIDNLIAYIKTGIERDHHILIIENAILYTETEKKIKKLFTNEQQRYIHYVDNHSFYNCNNSFQTHAILERFSEILKPFINKNSTIRTWAQVEWKQQDNITNKLKEAETLADTKIRGVRTMSVCAYAASSVNASLQNSMMRSHEYLMTDTEFVRSSFYRDSD